MFKAKPPVINPRKRQNPGLFDMAPPAVQDSPPTTPDFRQPTRHTDDGGEDFEFDKTPPTRKPWLAIGLLIGAIAAGFGLSVQYDSLLGQIAVATLGAGSLHGLWRGGLRKLVMLPASLGMLVLLASHPGFADPLIKMVAGKSSELGNGLACVAAFVLAMLAAGTVVRVIRNRIIMKRPFLRATDRLFGTTLGAAEGALILLTICWTAVLVEPHTRSILEEPSIEAGSVQHKFAAGLVRLTEEIDGSPLRPIVRDANPIEEIPALRDAIENLKASGPNAIDSKVRKAAMEALKTADPEKLGVLQKLVRDQARKDQSRDNAYRQLPKPTDTPPNR